jgi:hypothetical protein
MNRDIVDVESVERISYIVVCMGSHLETNVNKYKFNEVEFHASGIGLA